MLKVSHIYKLSLKLILVGILIISLGCEKEEGEGGTSSISGKIFVNDYDNQGNLTGSYYGADEDVYLIYGGSSTLYDDKYETSYDGTYRFEYLTKGHYKIFAYSDCDSCLSGTEVVIIEHEITENNKDYVLEDLVVRR